MFLQARLDLSRAKSLAKKYDRALNISLVARLSSVELNHLLREESPYDREILLRFIVSLWIKAHTPLNEVTLRTLKRLIKGLQLTLTERDQHDLALLEARVFAAERDFKAMPISLPGYEREVINIKFDRGALYAREALLAPLINGVIYVSTLAITLVNADSSYRVLWADIWRYEFMSYGFEFKVGATTLVLRAHDQPSLNATLYNFVTRKGLDDFKKR